MTIAETALPAPVRLPPDAQDGGLAFHRLVFARRRTAWWTPLLVGVLGVVLYVAMLLVLVVVAVVGLLISSGGPDSMPMMSDSVAFDITDPFVMIALLGSLALLLPAYLLASLIVNGRRVGLISSAAGRIRWRWMLMCGVGAVAVSAVLVALSMLIPADAAGEAGNVVSPADNPNFWAVLAVILLVVPFQAAAEEYIFRGYLQQSIGRWLRHPLFAILLPVPLFVLGHGYDPLGQAGVAVFAVAAGWLTWRTGGLEAAIALHVVNNLPAFLQALLGFSDINNAAPGVVSFVFSTLMVGGYVAIVEALVRRARLPRTLVLRAPAPVG